jgi:integrase
MLKFSVIFKGGMRMPLTAKEVKEAKPRNSRYLLHDGDGLVLEVMTSGSKIWRFRDQRGGREVKITLGKYPYLSLQDAREKRYELRKAQLEGLNVQEVLNPPMPVVAEPAFADVANEGFARRIEGQRSDRHQKNVRNRLNRYLLPALGVRPVAEITASELLQVIHHVEGLGYANLAHNLKQIAGQILQYAVLTGKVVHNVAADLKGALQPVQEKHYPSLTAPKDVAELMKRIEAYPNAVIRLAMLFSAYTFQRPGEIRKAEWSEFDLGEAEWRIPPDRMKRGRAHIVPLSRQALGVLRQAQDLNSGSKFVFSFSQSPLRPLSASAVRTALSIMGYEKGTMTPHGFRSLASTNLNAQGVDKELVEIQLSHRDENYTRAAYNFADRLPERRVMMQNWADWLDSLFNKEHDYTVYSTVGSDGCFRGTENRFSFQ